MSLSQRFRSFDHVWQKDMLLVPILQHSFIPFVLSDQADVIPVTTSTSQPSRTSSPSLPIPFSTLTQTAVFGWTLRATQGDTKTSWQCQRKSFDSLNRFTCFCFYSYYILLSCFFIRCEIKIFGMPGYLRPHRQAFTPLCRVKSYEGRIIQTQSRKMMHAQTKFQPRPGLRYPTSLKVKRYTLFRRSVP